MTSTNKAIADRDFEGNGVILCRICDRPVLEHRIGRCPVARDIDMFYGPSTAASGHMTEVLRNEKEANE